MARVSEPVTPEQLPVAPANQASWELAALVVTGVLRLR